MDTIKCECGCGQEFNARDKKGRPRRFINGHNNRGPGKGTVTWRCVDCGKERTSFRSEVHRSCCVRANKRGPLHPSWKGGRRKVNGYVYVWAPDHPEAVGNGMMLEHRLEAEKMLGRPLRPDEHVHHMNHQRDDNRPENLLIMSKREHLAMHGAEGNRKRFKHAKRDLGR